MHPLVVQNELKASVCHFILMITEEFRTIHSTFQMMTFIPEPENIVHERVRINMLDKAAGNGSFQIPENMQSKMNPFIPRFTDTMSAHVSILYQFYIRTICLKVLYRSKYISIIYKHYIKLFAMSLRF